MERPVMHATSGARGKMIRHVSPFLTTQRDLSRGKTMEKDFEQAVFVEILQSVGVLSWLTETTGLDEHEVILRADSDFDGLLATLQEAQP